MRSISIFATFQAFIIVALLIFTPIFTGIVSTGSTSHPILKPPQSVINNPILKTNPTTADAMLTYSQTALQMTITPPAGVSFLDEVERYVLDFTNVERRKYKLSILKYDPMLQTAARTHSADMLEREFFDHASPEGRTLYDRIAIIHRQLIGLTGENIGMWQGYDVNEARKLAEEAVDGWMNSPGHRENILRPHFSHLGVGAAVKGDTVKITQNFSSTQALFKQPLPLKVKSGDLLDLKTKRGLQRYAPVRYAFWVSETGMLAAEDVSMMQQQVMVPPGDYRLRLYFVKSRKQGSVNYIIYNGPQIVVE